MLKRSSEVSLPFSSPSHGNVSILLSNLSVYFSVCSFDSLWLTFQRKKLNQVERISLSVRWS
jgi:hypothetical protein